MFKKYFILFLLIFIVSGCSYKLTDQENVSFQKNIETNEINKTIVIQEVDLDNKKVSINFEKCQKVKSGVSFGFGSTQIEVVGKKDNSCLIKFGTEIEMSSVSWINCTVPISEGNIIFSVGNFGINITSIDKYCK